MWAATLGRPCTWATWQKAATRIATSFPNGAPEKKGATNYTTLVAGLRREVMSEIYGPGWEQLPGARLAAPPGSDPQLTSDVLAASFAAAELEEQQQEALRVGDGRAAGSAARPDPASARGQPPAGPQ